jgi:hypothetical protein
MLFPVLSIVTAIRGSQTWTQGSLEDVFSQQLADFQALLVTR